MASYQSLCFLVFTSLLLVSASHSSPGTNVVATEEAASVLSRKSSSQKVDLALYYEALCPYCKKFIVGLLANAVETDLITIVNLKLVPYGNAVIIQNKTVQCQHGEDECYLNTIHACAINLWPDMKTHFNFIKCIEQQTTPKNGVDTTWKSCADQLGLPKDGIQQCYDSGHGKELLLKYGNDTDRLHPPHEYVPWVVVGEKPLLIEFENFVDYVCKAYKGTPLPKACSSQHTNLTEKKRSIQPVCHAGARSAKNPSIPSRKLEPHV